MRRQLVPALRMLLVMTVLCGVGYTAVVTLAAQGIWAEGADGSPVEVGGEIVGSELLGQAFVGPGYFHPRPSAIGYDPTLSGGSNYGPNNPEYLQQVRTRVAEYRESNGLDAEEAVPVDAVTASASGLDPEITVANARLQARRVAAARAVPLEEILELIDSQSGEVSFGYLSDPAVNVLMLNVALDAAYGR